MSVKRMAIVSGYVPSLVDFRGPLIRCLIEHGWEVWALGPEDETERVSEVEDLGARFVGYPLARAGLNPIADLKSFLVLRRCFREIRPELILGYTAKPMVYASLAGRCLGAASVSLVTGLGYAFTGNSWKKRILRLIQTTLYRVAFAGNCRVVFQNHDDRSLFVARKYVNERKTRVVHGSGVDLKKYGPPPERNWDARPLVFVMVARLLREKGIAEFLDAAVEMKRDGARARFILVGGRDPNPGAFNPRLVRQAVQDGVLEWKGAVKDVRPYLKEAHVFVLPSYREGTPRSTLEALAMGLPVLTTSAVGCRETIRDGINGFEVPARNAAALYGAMRRFLGLSAAELEDMGKKSLELARDRFDVVKVNEMLRAFLEEASR